MAKYAAGLHARAECDRCGLEYPYLSLRTQWDNLRVCPECYDPKHPQIEPRTATDRTSLYQPRPGEHAREDVAVKTIIGMPMGFSTSTLYDKTDWLILGPNADTNVGTFSIGDGYTIFTGLQVSVTGEAITSADGTLNPTAKVLENGVQTNVSLSNETPQAAVIESGEAITTAVGTADVNLHTWGTGKWGSGSWGD